MIEPNLSYNRLLNRNPIDFDQLQEQYNRERAMSTNTIREDRHKLLFEERWFTPLFRECKAAGLDWMRMAAIAKLLSDGDSQARSIDWDFIHDTLGPENPLMAGFYDEEQRPTEEIIDRGTRWGLFQVHGEIAKQNGYRGQFAGLTSIDAGIKAGVNLMKRALGELEAYIDTCEAQSLDAAKEQDNIRAADLMQKADNARNNLPGNAEYRAFGINGDSVSEVVKLMSEEFDRLRSLAEA